MIEIILSGGLVYDGLGGAPLRADIAVTDDSIAGIGDYSGIHAGRTIDVTGLAVAPGFIDIHTHSDFTLLINRPMRSSLAQGVTTEVVGNCGTSIGLVSDTDVFSMEKRWAERGGTSIDWTRMAGYLRRVEEGGLSCNVASLAGHGTIRKAVMDFDNRPPTEVELAKMGHILAQALEDGAIGLSTGLEYLPGGYAEMDELVALAKISRDAGGFYATHMRNEGDTLIESVAEAIAVAEGSGVPLQVSHHKAEVRRNWGKVKTTLGMMADARARGMDVLTDQYPYDAYMTGLSVIILPGWANDGSPADTAARLKDPITRSRIIGEINASDWDWNLIRIGLARMRREVQGLSIAELAARDGVSPAEAAVDLLAHEEGWVAAAHFAMSDADIDAVLRDPHTMIGSDGVATDPNSALAEDQIHPRTYGTFPRVLGRYVRERGVITLSEAVRRMTSLPAQRLKLHDRGRLAAGMKADITVFDPAKVTDLATFEHPHQYSAGIEHVIVNGRVALTSGVQSDVLAGRVLRRE